MPVRKLKKSWQYDFRAPGDSSRYRRAGFRTKAEALAAERKAREEIVNGHRKITFADAYHRYLSGTRIGDRTLDTYKTMWRDMEPALGHLFIEEVDTSTLDTYKQSLPTRLGPRSVNKRLALVSAVLRFMWKRQKLASLPYIPKEQEHKKPVEWYTTEERDAFLVGMFNMYPQWFLFFYITMRLGLRCGEVYALSHSRVRSSPPGILIDRAVQRGLKDRPAKLITRKNKEAYWVDLTDDLVGAIAWHVHQGYSGPEFFFSADGTFPKLVDSHNRPRKTVQKALGLRLLSHHKLGRHSVGGQAVTAGHSLKAIQGQLGHRSAQSTHIYAHIGDTTKRALVMDLAPALPPHGNAWSTFGQRAQIRSGSDNS